jgi:hypothetical protein
MERPYLVNAWLQQLLLERQREGGLNISSPVLARAYHLLSEGMNVRRAGGACSALGPLWGLPAVRLPAVAHPEHPSTCLPTITWHQRINATAQQRTRTSITPQPTQYCMCCDLAHVRSHVRGCPLVPACRTPHGYEQ